MEWERAMAKRCTLIGIYAINGGSQDIKTAFCLIKVSQKEKKATRPVDYLTLFEIKKMKIFRMRRLEIPSSYN